MLLKRSPSLQWASAVVAIFALTLVLVRAIHQSVTIDEAASFLQFAAPSWPAHWYPSSGNHVLNTILTRIAVGIIGVSPLAIRLPAFAAAILYVFVSYWFSVMLMRGQLAQGLLFAVLTLNPFVLDYLVAARGYALALAFYMLALYTLVKGTGQSSNSYLRAGFLSSIYIGCSIAANYAFGFVGVVTLALFLIRMAIDAQRGMRIKLTAALILPAVAALLVICGPALTNYSRRELVYGTDSLVTTIISVSNDIFDGPNPMVVNQTIAPIFWILHNALPFVALVTIATGVALALRSRLFGSTAVMLAAIMIVTLLLHEAAFVSAHVLLPRDRTALYLAPLFTLTLAATVESSRSTLFSRLAVMTLALCAIFFVGALRTESFREWPFDAHVNDAYDVIHKTARANEEVTVAANWRYVSVLEFYRYADRDNMVKIDPANPSGPLAPARSLYVLYPQDDAGFEKRHHLRPLLSISNGDDGDIIVAAPISSR